MIMERVNYQLDYDSSHPRIYLVGNNYNCPIIRLVEDERTFNTLSFMKSKLKNRLTGHLDLVIHMFSQHFYTLENFPYDVAIQEGKEMHVQYGDDA
jgi:hypothetical protein